MAFSHSSPLALLLLLFLLLVTLREISGAFDYSPEDLRSERRLADLFERWILHHGKVYKDDDINNNNNNKLGTIVSLEKVRRFHIFKRNLRFIHAHNEGRLVSKGPGSRSYRLGLNHFADLTHEEFKASYLGFNFGPHQEKVKVDSPMKDHDAKYDEVAEVVGNSKLPKSMDWRERGAVTPIKNQGSCGSCWAFSTIGAIEGAHAIATGTLISLSEQELVSCDHHNAGCRGGFMDDAFKWVMKNGGINTEEGYPYMSGGSRTHMCRIFKKLHKVVKIDGYKDVPPNDEYMLQHAVSQQPISVAINAGTPEFQFYAGGVFSDGCSDDPNSIDHAVLVVGWGSTSDGEDYWIVKNSWSEEWGLKGYIHMKRGTGKVRGTCGIHTIPSYPIIKQASGIFEENNNLAMATS